MPLNEIRPYTRHTRIPLEISLCRYGIDISNHIVFLGVSRGQLLNFHIPLIMNICPVREDNYWKSTSKSVLFSRASLHAYYLPSGHWVQAIKSHPWLLSAYTA